jgi:ADP-ribose pyrophosphatase YjhB (NUDIX family)
METFTCKNKCCLVKIKPYIKNPNEKPRRPRKKAGVFIYDPKQNKVLLIQSKGRLWGPPKGTLNCGETDRICAVREVMEETGLEISTSEFTRATTIKHRAIYFYIERDECNVNLQDHIRDNDANGICWMTPDCIEQCILDGNILLTQHCRIVFKRFLNKTFPHSTFTVIVRKKRFFKP